jgi:hypothetical protein
MINVRAASCASDCWRAKPRSASVDLFVGPNIYTPFEHGQAKKEIIAQRAGRERMRRTNKNSTSLRALVFPHEMHFACESIECFSQCSHAPTRRVCAKSSVARYDEYVAHEK